MSLIGSMMGDSKGMNDQAIANNLIFGSKGMASAYLAVTLESSTPELKAMFAARLNQIIAGHTALVDLAVTKGWYKPYDMPEQQLFETYKQSESMMEASR
ncbi:hypothetical protein SYNTR_2090 [Candidatus Syntrophocurvum alkaliphilum]|uniref:Spore coat protein F n=1 Tax=Candidatus Syntrophocurvum alkaliphilum TaxID=2293317 RepID=A0A6I6DIJ4_9FIRM|nr:spore coat protein [Candidatus Syntrophocurvum alkaliphilum]QGU00684.1 hypothetical protein SYNTR_2090 [Candidatus Syntrophocurvum alkaliphilum]